jgi:hypothetical protein
VFVFGATGCKDCRTSTINVLYHSMADLDEGSLSVVDGKKLKLEGGERDKVCLCHSMTPSNLPVRVYLV